MKLRSGCLPWMVSAQMKERLSPYLVLKGRRMKSGGINNPLRGLSNRKWLPLYHTSANRSEPSRRAAAPRAIASWFCRLPTAL